MSTVSPDQPATSPLPAALPAPETGYELEVLQRLAKSLNLCVDILEEKGEPLIWLVIIPEEAAPSIESYETPAQASARIDQLRSIKGAVHIFYGVRWWVQKQGQQWNMFTGNKLYPIAADPRTVQGIDPSGQLNAEPLNPDGPPAPPPAPAPAAAQGIDRNSASASPAPPGTEDEEDEEEDEEQA